MSAPNAASAGVQSAGFQTNLEGPVCSKAPEVSPPLPSKPATLHSKPSACPDASVMIIFARLLFDRVCVLHAMPVRPEHPVPAVSTAHQALRENALLVTGTGLHCAGRKQCLKLSNWLLWDLPFQVSACRSLGLRRFWSQLGSTGCKQTYHLVDKLTGVARAPACGFQGQLPAHL